MPDEAVSPPRSRLAVGSFFLALVAAAPVLGALVVLAVCGHDKRSPAWIAAVVCLVPVFPLCALIGLGLGIAGVVTVVRKRLAGLRLAVSGTVLSAAYFLFVLTFFGYGYLTAPGLNAINALRQYAEEQESYREDPRAPGGEYASDYRKLVGAWYLRNEHKLPTYRFRECGTIAGQPINWQQDFAICATPSKYCLRAKRTFIVKTDGAIWSKDLGRPEFVADFPADPAKAGWMIAE